MTKQQRLYFINVDCNNYKKFRHKFSEIWSLFSRNTSKEVWKLRDLLKIGEMGMWFTTLTSIIENIFYNTPGIANLVRLFNLTKTRLNIIG